MTLQTVASPASEVLARWYDAWNAQEVAAISALITDDIHYEVPAAQAQVLRGRRAVELYARVVFRRVPDLRFEKLEEWVTPGGEMIASYFRMVGTFSGALVPGDPQSAKDEPSEALGMDRSELDGGRIGRHQIFWDGRMFQLAR